MVDAGNDSGERLIVVPEHGGPDVFVIDGLGAFVTDQGSEEANVRAVEVALDAAEEQIRRKIA